MKMFKQCLLMMTVLFVSSTFASVNVNKLSEGQEGVQDAVSTTDKLCSLVKNDDYQNFLRQLITADVRLHSNYKELTCSPVGDYTGGSLLKTADHFASKRIFDYLVQSIAVEDIFWEAPEMKSERLVAKHP